MNAFGLPDPIPSAPRADLQPAAETRRQISRHCPDAKQFRLPNVGSSLQKSAVDRGVARAFPLIFTTGRLVEYEGGGEETRSNKWLAELQQEMFVEINPADAVRTRRQDGAWVWVTGAENKPRQRSRLWSPSASAKGVVWMPYHFGGWFEGKDLRDRTTRRCRSDRARRERQHHDKLRLRSGDGHAGAKDDAVPGSGRRREEDRWRE